jgi:hypothetical protein
MQIEILIAPYIEDEGHAYDKPLRVTVETTSESVRLLPHLPGENSEIGPPEMYLEARPDGWALYVYDSDCDEPSWKITVGAGGSFDVEKVLP